VALISTDGSEDRIPSEVMVHDGEPVTERSCKLLYRHRLLGSSETSVLIRATRCHIPEDDNHHSHRRGNLKSYIKVIDYKRVLTMMYNRITGFSDFVHRPVFEKLGIHNVSETGSVSVLT
jgi:hypothetical protein